MGIGAMGDSMHFLEDGTLVTGPRETERDMGVCRSLYIPPHHVEIIRQNLIDGMGWSECSPVYPVTKEIAAFILTGAYDGE
jgi:hypothetical protein